MLHCPDCGSAIDSGNRFCAGCGSKLDLASLPTEVYPEGVPPTTPAGPVPAGTPVERAGVAGPVSAVTPSGAAAVSGPGGFVAGQLLDGRYRIVGPLGRGGMGEVYRADDLRLGQPVALKFLAPALARDARIRERFHHEVRTARQISHPNVCRVHDIGEIEGRLFLSMEYIDGEDLASLGRRIGHLPRDKAVEIAQQLCGGLAAAHGQGMLHRDLKPANVMLDGRGRVKITDFGLAGFGHEIEDVRSGTPAYMAPEQLAGREVTTRSDIYSLGLVLYEVFTGKAAFKAESLADLQTQQESAPTTPSSHVADIDSTTEKVILRCLERDPAKRPETALAVAAALPGGDPLAAALAAGETPSPEMVAAAGEEGTLSPPVAAGLLLIFLLTLGCVVGWFGKLQIVQQVPLDLPRQVLVDRAQRILAGGSEPTPPEDWKAGFSFDNARLRYLRAQPPSAERWREFGAGPPATLQFWYRESPYPMASQRGFFSRIGWADPPPDKTGMVRLSLETDGRLRFLERVPVQRDEEVDHGVEPDWAALFDAAGLEVGAFTETASSWVPPVHADVRRAWIGTHPDVPDEELRIESAGFGGEAVYFQMIWPWTPATRMTPATPAGVVAVVVVIFLMLLISLAIYTARRNLKAGRGDRTGAIRLAGATFLIYLFVWLLWGDRPSNITSVWGQLVKATGFAMFVSGLIWTMYMALEPYIRRRFPDRIVGWTRLLAGRFRDALVGRDVLIGLAAGSVFALLLNLAVQVGRWVGDPAVVPGVTWLGLLNGARHSLGRYLFNHPDSAVGAMLLALLWFLLRGLFRRTIKIEWPATLILVGLLTLQLKAQLITAPWIGWTFSILAASVLVLVLARFGLLALVTAMIAGNMLANQSIPPSLTSWWAGGTWLVLGLLLALGLYAFSLTLGRQRLLADPLDHD